MLQRVLLIIVWSVLSQILIAQNNHSLSASRQQSVTSPILLVRLVAEVNGERVYYTPKEWENLSLKDKVKVDKLGISIGSGNDTFLLSLHNNMGSSSQTVTHQEALNATGGQLPTKAQWQLIKRNLRTINSALEAFGGNPLYVNYYWGQEETYVYMGGSPTSFDNRAMFRICSNDVEKGFKEVVVERAEGEQYDYMGSGPSWKGDDCLQIVGLRNKFGLIDTLGHVVVPIKYDDIDGGSHKKEYNNSWSGDGLISVCMNGKWGYVDRKGKVVVPLMYDEVDPRCYVPSKTFHPGVTRVCKERLLGCIDYRGELLLPIEYNEIEGSYGRDLFFAKKEGKYGFFNQNYQLIVPFKYDYTSGFRDNEEYCAVGVDGRYGYIDKTGKEVIPLSYDFAASFHNGLAAVVKNNKLGYVNHAGEIEIPLQFEYDYVDFYYDQTYNKSRKDLHLGSKFYSPYIAFVKSADHKLAIINRKGELLSSFKYDRLQSAGSSGFICVVGNQMIYLDRAGNEYSTQEERTRKSTEYMAMQGYVDAQADWGRKLIKNGKLELAHEWLYKAVYQGSVDALKIIADDYRQRKEYKRAFDWYVKAAEGGDVESLLCLGDLFYQKEEIEHSNAKAAEWFLKYIASPDREALNKSVCYYKLGHMHYYGGYGIEVSYAKAMDFFSKSDSNGARYYLGWMYEHGQGVTKDLQRAIELYRESNGVRDSKERIKRLESQAN